MLAEFEVDRVFHLAALLSTRSEFTPVTRASRQRRRHAQPARVRAAPGRVARAAGDVHLSLVDRRLRSARSRRPRPAPARSPRISTRIRRRCTGATSCTASSSGDYYARHYKQLSADAIARVDFRGVRFPGLISAMTLPSGGTSDYAPEMIHAAAKGEPYDCFVRPDTTIPFMAMPDGVDALLTLAAAPRDRLTRSAYNLAAFNPSAAEIRDVVRRRVSGRDASTTRSTRSGRASSTRGRRRWTIRRRAATGASIRTTTSSAPSAST